MNISVESFPYGGDPSKPHSAHGFNVPRPDLPLAAAVWDTADRYGKRSDTLFEELFTAVVALEKEVRRLSERA